MGPMPRSRLVKPVAQDEFVGPPAPGFFDKIKDFFKFPPTDKITGESIAKEVEERFEKAAIAKPVIQKAVTSVSSSVSSTLKKSVILVVLASVVFIFVYAFAGRLAMRVAR